MDTENYNKLTQEELIAQLTVANRHVDELERSKRRVGLSFRRVPESGYQISRLHNGDFPYLQHISSLSYTHKNRNTEELKADKALTETTDGNITLIEGDNLPVLTTLQLTHKGRIDVIYIDPPYNTGNNDFIYNDARKSSIADIEGASPEDYEATLDGKNRAIGKDDPERHSLWLSFMEKRLYLAKELLTDTGVIFVSIDDNEHARLKLLMDEVFGEQSFVTNIAWRRSDNQANIGSIATVKEYILVYGMSKFSARKLPLSDKAKLEYRYTDSKGVFRRGILLDKTRGRHFYEVETPSGNKLSGPWMKPEYSFKELQAADGIYWTSGNQEQPYSKIFLEESKGQISSDFWGTEFGTNQRASKEIESIFGMRAFDFTKPRKLIETLIKIGCSKNNSIVLDFFAGSGTTGHAVAALNAEDGGNRQCILVTHGDENGKNIAEDVTALRMKRVLSGLDWADGKEHDGLPGEFNYYKLAFAPKTSNPMTAVETMQTKFVGIAALQQDVVLSHKYAPNNNYIVLDSSKKVVVMVKNEEYLLDEIDELFSILETIKAENDGKELIVYAPSEDEDDIYGFAEHGWKNISFPIEYLKTHVKLIDRMKKNKTLLPPVTEETVNFNDEKENN